MEQLPPQQDFSIAVRFWKAIFIRDIKIVANRDFVHRLKCCSHLDRLDGRRVPMYVKNIFIQDVFAGTFGGGRVSIRHGRSCLDNTERKSFWWIFRNVFPCRFRPGFRYCVNRKIEVGEDLGSTIAFADEKHPCRA